MSSKPEPRRRFFASATFASRMNGAFDFFAGAGAAGFASLEALLTGSDADIVSLCTPSGLHPLQAMQAAAAGRHVLSEKPMATRLQDGLDMVRACQQAGVQLFVVKQNRLNPTVQMLKQAIEAGRFGRVHMATVNVFWTRPQAYYDQAPWRGQWELDGGAFMNQASPSAIESPTTITVELSGRYHVA